MPDFEIEESEVETTRDCSGSGGGRKDGCAYVVNPTGPFGIPLSKFMICPPIPVNLEAFGWTANGINIWEIDGVYHLVDIMGATFWPTVPDVVEEIARGGGSNLVPMPVLRQFLPKRTSDSKLFLVHHNAVINNPAPLVEKILHSTRWMGESCPSDRLEHNQNLSVHCIRQNWQCVARMPEDQHTGEAYDFKGGFIEIDERYFLRNRTIAHYTAASSPEDYKPEYDWGIFMWLPINKIEIPYDLEETCEEKAAELQALSPDVNVIITSK